MQSWTWADQDLNLYCFSHAFTPIPAGEEPAFKGSALNNLFLQQTNSDSFIALCLLLSSLPGARDEKVLGHPLLLEAGEQ